MRDYADNCGNTQGKLFRWVCLKQWGTLGTHLLASLAIFGVALTKVQFCQRLFVSAKGTAMGWVMYREERGLYIMVCDEVGWVGWLPAPPCRCTYRMAYYLDMRLPHSVLGQWLYLKVSLCHPVREAWSQALPTSKECDLGTVFLRPSIQITVFFIIPALQEREKVGGGGSRKKRMASQGKKQFKCEFLQQWFHNRSRFF